MSIYIETCAISMLIAWLMQIFRYRKNKLTKKIQAFMTIIPLVFVSGLRYGIGTDYFAYEDIFEHGYFSENIFKAPIYFKLYRLVIQYFGGDYAISVFIISLLFFYLIFYRVFEDSPYPWLSVFLIFGLLYFFISMNAMRQSFAIAILVYSLRYIEKRQTKYFLLCLIIATGIHNVSIVFFAIYFLYHINFNIRKICLFTIIMLITINTAYVLLPDFFDLTDSVDYMNNQQNIGVTWIANFLFQILIVIYSYYIYSKNIFTDKRESNRFKTYFCTQLMAFWCYFLVFQINMNEVYRMVWIFNIFSIILVPVLVDKIKNVNLRLISLVVLIMVLSINMYINIAVLNMHHVLPYVSIFD